MLSDPASSHAEPAAPERWRALLGADAARVRALVTLYDRPGPRYTSYPPVTAWRPMEPAEYRARLARVCARPDALSLYVHLPFCASRCLYCGCSAAVTRRTDVVEAYLGRLTREADLVCDWLGTGQRVTQLHLGGGTPNLLDDRQLVRAMRMLTDRFDVGPGAELSIEADPRLVTPSQLRTLVTLGFRRISFGVQDLDPGVQTAIGREQPASMVRDVVARSREAGFEGVNVDLIYGLPLQTADTFARTLDDVASRMRPDRIACFGYAHVPWARPHQRRIDEATLPGAEARFALFAQAVERLTDAGYAWIGLDHFALPHDALAQAQRTGRLTRDFMGYTTRPARHLVGLGVSSIGEVDGAFVQSAAKLGDWQRAVDAGELPVVRGHQLDAEDLRRREAIVGLMCDLAVPEPLVPRDAATQGALADLEADGLVAWSGGALRVTRLGRFFLRNVCMAFDATLARAAVGGAGDDAGNGAETPRFSRTV